MNKQIIELAKSGITDGEILRTMRALKWSKKKARKSK